MGSKSAERTAPGARTGQKGVEGHMEGTSKNLVNSIARAVKIMELLAEKRQLGISELARATGWKKTTVARIVQSLHRTGLVEQDQESRKFSLSLKLFELGCRVAGTLEIRQRARKHIEEFVQRQQLAVLLAVLSGGEVVYIDKAEPDGSGYSIKTPVGSRAPVHCTASGKALLAFLGEKERQAQLGATTLASYTEQSITDAALLEQDLAATRARGFSIDWEERLPGVCAVGAPIFDYTNRVVASVSCPMLTATCPRERIAEYGMKVAELAKRISFSMGYQKADRQQA